MKFKEIIQLNEALSDNKELMKKLEALWSPSIPSGDVIKYVKFFERVQNNLSPQVKGKKFDAEIGKQVDIITDYVPVGKFLSRYPNFEVKNLKEIDKYTAEQIKFLFSEIEKVPLEYEPDVFTVNPDRNPNNPKKNIPYSVPLIGLRGLVLIVISEPIKRVLKIVTTVSGIINAATAGIKSVFITTGALI